MRRGLKSDMVYKRILDEIMEEKTVSARPRLRWKDIDSVKLTADKKEATLVIREGISGGE